LLDNVISGDSNTPTRLVGVAYAINIGTYVEPNLLEIDYKLLTYIDVDKRVLVEENILLKGNKDNLLATLGALKRDLVSTSIAKTNLEESVIALRNYKQKL
jgi:hypothetical protein